MSLTAAPMPPEAPLDFPAQDFSAPPPAGPARRRWPGVWVALARLVAFGGALAIAVFGFQQMLLTFGDRGTLLQYVLLGLFTITFAWVGFSLTTLLAGLFARPAPKVPAVNDARLVVVMPIYHENPANSLGILSAMAAEIAAAGIGHRTEIFVLSDSRDPSVVAGETLAVQAARQAAPIPIWYRWRENNTDRKTGNLAEFIRRWGGRYDQMVVLDADSMMSGDTIKTLSDRLAADPALALIQTMPMLVGAETIFARLTQFAGRIYGPMIARGVAAWSGDQGNYWGHNAIIRMDAFAATCGLPHLPGRPPFGGNIQSHDFVEAALLVRAGWKVRLDHDLRGSYEGCPPTLLDMAVRERRWAQGNLQHARLIGMRGLSWVSRVHFVIGILGFVMSPIWLAMLLVGLVLSAVVLLSTPEYFPSTYQLFPDWPVFDSRRMFWLFAAAMGCLLLPKLVALFRAWLRPLARNAGGKRRLMASGLFEITLSALIAPVQMLTQTRQIGDILLGRDSGWEAQLRQGAMPSWSMVLRRHGWHVALGLGTLLVLASFSPAQLIWLSPILAGLILSPVTSRYSASPVFGRWARMRGLLVTPEERDPPAIVSASGQATRRLPQPLAGDAAIAQLADADLRARHLSVLPAVSNDLPPARRLPALTARAKLDAASSRAEALTFLDRPERMALILDPRLLDQFAALPA
ncbi:MAG: glucans biosynthesis glucosyltransferase MdoH [Paracoccus sp. (in: a-proteobacteria)]|uniref:glucans biosynthesis glucosyltransferase MdoH n=1 Tax=Paracoccus sp. TaxID=267 RepID=UPI0026E06888|nr:glucans biosynthesis glucosyltransferase MdoH [Paracoccus sp. (in: a-proteobacteria)]MDO5621315.1 glucans biosynthesis glucosyltransferase MdoH [Paracoccus sp. (in: a-proteobacteria)]